MDWRLSQRYRCLRIESQFLCLCVSRPKTSKHATLFFMVSGQEAQIPLICILPDLWDPNNEEFSVSKYNSTLAHAMFSPFPGPLELEIEDIDHYRKKPSLHFPGAKQILSVVYLGAIIKLYLTLVKKKKQNRKGKVVIYSLYAIPMEDATFQASSHTVTLS